MVRLEHTIVEMVCIRGTVHRLIVKSTYTGRYGVVYWKDNEVWWSFGVLYPFFSSTSVLEACRSVLRFDPDKFMRDLELPLALAPFPMQQLLKDL